MRIMDSAQLSRISTNTPKRPRPSPRCCKNSPTARWFPQAQTTLTAVITQKLPTTPEAAYWLGRTLIQLKLPAQVLTTVDPVIAANPQSEFLPHLQLVRIDSIYEQPERRKETAALYATFATTHANHELAPEAKYRAALAALQTSDFVNAQTHAEAFLANAAWAKHPLLPEVVFVGAEAFLLAMPDANLAKAEPLYRRLVAEFATNAHVPQAQVRIGLCLYSAAVTANQPPKFEDCIGHFNPMIATLKEPAHLAEARFLMGRTHGELKRHAEAITAFRAALQAKPDWDRTDEVLLALGVSLRATNDPTNAVVELTKLTQ